MTPTRQLGAPLFIVGAPRSGTTYMVELLNRHSLVLVTNELRVMTFLNRVINRLAPNRWTLLNGRGPFLEFLRGELPGLLERYYVQLGAPPGARWGDKNPHYADSRTDPECFDLIDALFPDAQFVNMVRDGRDIVASVVSKGWTDFDEAVDVWRRHVVHAEEFAERIGPDRMLTIRYEDLVADDVAVVGQVCDFLGLAVEPAVTAFAAEQAAARTPFSKPTTDIGDAGRRPVGGGLTDAQRSSVDETLHDLLDRYGYS